MELQYIQGVPVLDQCAEVWGTWGRYVLYTKAGYYQIISVKVCVWVCVCVYVCLCCVGMRVCVYVLFECVRDLCGSNRVVCVSERVVYKV